MNPSGRKQIFSIGHSNRTLVEFIDILKGFGMEYLWIKSLGGMRGGGYEEYMNTPAFADGLDALISAAGEKKTAFMCAELDWRGCHRGFVSHALHKLGWEVVHVYDENESETHSGLF